LLYARILVELNRAREAEPMVRLYPVPHPNSQQEFLSLTIPQYFATRAAAFAAQGKTGEADSSRKIFQTLSGKATPVQ